MLNHTADTITGAHIYTLLEISLNEPNKLASLIANQTEIVFKESNNISAITFELVDKIKTLRNKISNLTHEFLFSNILFYFIFILFYNTKLMIQPL